MVDWVMGQMVDLQVRFMDCLFDYLRIGMTLNDDRNFARPFAC